MIVRSHFLDGDFCLDGLEPPQDKTKKRERGDPEMGLGWILSHVFVTSPSVNVNEH